MEDEIFGPILPILSFSNLDEIIKQIKAKPKPLAFYAFSNDKAVKDKLLNEISFGGGAINDTVMHICNPHLPFGGVGESGMGNYHGLAGFNAFSHQKSVLEKPFWFEPPLKYSPYSKTKLSWIKWIMRL
jgi:aldehyde dehydrogenase (NAD+)